MINNYRRFLLPLRGGWVVLLFAVLTANAGDLTKYCNPLLGTATLWTPEDLGYTRDRLILHELNNYPVMSPHAHLRPFKNKWLNMACGVVLPVGLFFYFRSWAFRVRLANDLDKVVQTNQEVIKIINTRILKDN